jgi:hypothetical protein
MSTETKEKEWLQFLEVIKRKYGYNSYNWVKINYYNKRETRSVAEYFSSIHKFTDLNIDTKSSIKILLKNKDFMKKFNTDADINQFTEIYSETDWLMRSINNEDENIYIKCNPVDDNGNIVDSESNNLGASANSINSMLEELSNTFNPELLYRNVGLQAAMAIGFLAIVYSIGNYLFVHYPKNMIAKRVN